MVDEPGVHSRAQSREGSFTVMSRKTLAMVRRMASASRDQRPWRSCGTARTVGVVNTSTTVELSGCELLAVAADPVRWRLLAALGGGTRCVCQLQPIAGVSAPALSHHLKMLRLAQLVTAARRGKWIDYALAPDAMARLHAALPVPGSAGAAEPCCPVGSSA